MRGFLAGLVFVLLGAGLIFAAFMIADPKGSPSEATQLWTLILFVIGCCLVIAGPVTYWIYPPIKEWMDGLRRQGPDDSNSATT